MFIYDTNEFPYEEFGDEIKRKIRIISSPYTTGEERCSIVVATLPPGGISEGHIHEDADEYICFDTAGEAILGDEKFIMKKDSILFAKKGVFHECRNTSNETMTLFCIFIPALEPYGMYPKLITKTKEFLEAAE